MTADKFCITEALLAIEELVYGATTERPFFGWEGGGMTEAGRSAFRHIEVLISNPIPRTPEQTK